MQKEMTLKEKEERWINAINRKNIDCPELTHEEHYFELETFQVLFEDEYITFSVEYGNEYGITLYDGKGNTLGCSLFNDFIYGFDYPFNEIAKECPLKEQNLREYMRSREFPITFKTWD